jgi:hypothetical protein
LQASPFCLLGCLLLGWGESQFGDRKILGQAKGQVKFLYTILTFPGGKSYFKKAKRQANIWRTSLQSESYPSPLTEEL